MFIRLAGKFKHCWKGNRTEPENTCLRFIALRNQTQLSIQELCEESRRICTKAAFDCRTEIVFSIPLLQALSYEMNIPAPAISFQQGEESSSFCFLRQNNEELQPEAWQSHHNHHNDSGLFIQSFSHFMATVYSCTSY